MMLVFDFIAIGNKLYSVRKKTGMTQAQVAEAAGLSDRTYADIERGSVNMRIESFLKICNVLHVTPNEILTDGGDTFTDTNGILEKLTARSAKEQQTAMMLLEVYLQSLE
jgi:transcriptional regulator with XRE-family HTH domain